MSECRILVVEDDAALREALSVTLHKAGYRVHCAENGTAAIATLDGGRPGEEFGMVVSDVQMAHMDGLALLKEVKARRPDLPVLLMTAYGTIKNAVEAMRDGAVDYLVKPFEVSALLQKITRFALPAGGAGEDGDLVLRDARVREVFDLARRVAHSDATVMINGESGTGKEVLARFLHRHSRRAKQPFVAINCAAIPDNMLEAMLFGYEKGAFTGAYQAHPGKFEQAAGGTLLLDEISEMNLSLQAKLLRVLQEREVERVGGRKLIPLDVRVLATSNRNMAEEVAKGRFREDLFYRLNVFPFYLPPLRERREDIIPLAGQLLAKHARALQRPAPDLNLEARTLLLNHTWPGNVRELDNVIQRALIVHSGAVLGAQDISLCAAPARLPVRGAQTGCATGELEQVPLPEAAGEREDGLEQDLRAHEQRLIVEALRTGRGSRKRAAEQLGISQRTLRYKLARLREAGVAIPGA